MVSKGHLMVASFQLIAMRSVKFQLPKKLESIMHSLDAVLETNGEPCKVRLGSNTSETS